MGLPPKSYFHLTEIAERWNASIQDMACYSLDGLLEIAVMTIGTRVETGRFEVSDRGVFRVAEGEKVLNGPQPVVSSDLWPVFRTGAGRITRFKPRSADGYIDLSQDVEPISVTLQDLLITSHGARAFRDGTWTRRRRIERSTVGKDPPRRACFSSATIMQRSCSMARSSVSASCRRQSSARSIKPRKAIIHGGTVKSCWRIPTPKRCAWWISSRRSEIGAL